MRIVEYYIFKFCMAVDWMNIAYDLYIVVIFRRVHQTHFEQAGEDWIDTIAQWLVCLQLHFF